MTIAHWLAIILASAAFAYRKRLGAMLQWHPATLGGNLIIAVAVIGMIMLAWWLLTTWGVWGIPMFLGAFAASMVAGRLYTGLWAWQDGDDVIDLD